MKSSTHQHFDREGQNSPLHDANAVATRKALKYLKGFSKVHPERGGNGDNVNVGDNGQQVTNEDEANGNSISAVHYDPRTAHVSVR